MAATAVLSLAAGAVRVPSPELLAGLACGVVATLVARWRLSAPAPALGTAQVIVGVTLGAYVRSDTLTALAADWLPVVAVSLATLALTVVAGLAMARFTSLDRPTAAFGMIAGGASGIVAIAGELGADNRLVAVMQYVRILVILALTPLAAQWLFAPGDGGGAVAAAADTSTAQQALFLGVSATCGIALARVLRLPAGTLLGPMLVAAGLDVAGAPFAGEIPGWLQSVAFAAIGLDVGLRFTPESLRRAGSVLLPTLAMVLLLLAACAGLGVILAELTGVTPLDGYLATTPGGLYAVLAAAVDSGSNTTFVLAVQVLRLFLMLLAAPLLARRLAGRGVRTADE